MSLRQDNPLLLGRWYAAQKNFSGNYSKDSDFIVGCEYRYCSDSHSHYDSSTSMRFKDRQGNWVSLWWEDDEPGSLLAERFGEPRGGYSLTVPKLLGWLFLICSVLALIVFAYLQLT